MRDETCNVVERDTYSDVGGRPLVTRTEGPTEVASFDWSLSGTGHVTGATVKTYLKPANPPAGNQQPLFVASTFGVDPASSRINALDEACSCGAPVARTWGRLPDGARVLTTNTTGTTLKKQTDSSSRQDSLANPYGYALPWSQRDYAPGVFPNLFPLPAIFTDHRYLHPLYRRPTETKRSSAGEVQPRTVWDFDDDDAAHPCVAGAARRSGNPQVPNEQPTPFLCATYEYPDTPSSTARVTRFSWDLAGRLLSVTRPGLDQTLYEYYPDDDSEPRQAGMLKAVVATGPGGPQLRTGFGDYHVTGQPELVTAPTAEVTQVVRDQRGRVVRVVAPDGAETLTSWEADGKPATVTLPRLQLLKNTYGVFGRLEKTELYAAGGGVLLSRRTFSHDLAGNVILEEDFDAASAAVTRRAQRDFDQGRRVTRELNDHGGTRVSEYADAMLRKVTDEANNPTYFFHDAFGRLRVVDDNAVNVGGHDYYLEPDAEYEWDSRDNLTRVTDANHNAIGYVFDGFNQLVTVQSKDTGTTRYEYTVDGLISRRIDANSATQGVDTSYDALRRPVAVDQTKLQLECLGQECAFRVTGRTPLTRYSWDDLDPARRALGRLSRVEDFPEGGGVLATDLSYNSDGRLERESFTRPGLSRPLALGFEYHPGGKLSTLTYPSQLPGQLPLHFDIALGGDDEVLSMKFGGAPVATAVSHYPFGGGLKGFTRGNGLATAIVHDKDGRRTAVTGGPVALSYSLDVRGLPQSLTESGDAPRYRVFEHDLLQRLTSASTYSSSAAQAVRFGEKFTYDAAGNRLTKTRADGKLFTSVFDQRPKPSGGTITDNNLLRAVVDPVAAGECERGGGGASHPSQGRPAGAVGARPACPPGPTNQELARVEAGWEELLNEARDLLEALPGLSEAELRGKTVAWVEKLRALVTEFHLSASTLQLLLFSASSGPHSFADDFNAFVQRRVEAAPLDATDLKLLKGMLELARKVPVRKAAERDPIWRYSYSPAGDVTQVVMSMPLTEVRPGAPEFQRVEVKYCYAHDARRRLVGVKYATRFDVTKPALPACDSETGLTAIAEYRYDSNNLRVYSKVFGLEKHYLFSPEGQVLAEANPLGVMEKAYLYLEGESLAQVVRAAGTGSAPPISGGLGCSSSGGKSVEWLVVGALALLVLGRARRCRGKAIAVTLAGTLLVSCDFAGGLSVETGPRKPAPKTPRPKEQGARLGDPIYYFHNDRLGTPVRLTDEAGRTVWRAEYRPFGDLESLEADPDRDGVAVENNLRFPGQYDEALGALLFQQGPYYNWNRWYDTGNGRYWQSDAMMLAPSAHVALADRGVSLQSYSYGFDSPLRFIDPTGRIPFLCGPGCFQKALLLEERTAEPTPTIGDPEKITVFRADSACPSGLRQIDMLRPRTRMYGNYRRWQVFCVSCPCPPDPLVSEYEEYDPQVVYPESRTPLVIASFCTDRVRL